MESSDKSHEKTITSKKVEKRARLENSVVEANLKTVFKEKIKKNDKLNKRIKSPHKTSASRDSKQSKKIEKKRKRNEEEGEYESPVEVIIKNKDRPNRNNTSDNITTSAIEENVEKVEKNNSSFVKKRKHNFDSDDRYFKNDEIDEGNEDKADLNKRSLTRNLVPIVFINNNVNNVKYIEPPPPPLLEPISKSEVTKFLECNSIQITGNLNFKPIMSFSQLKIDKEVKRVLKKFEKPTPIQATCWPICLNGKDVIAFTVPAVMHIKNTKNKTHSNQPIVLVISPTRELAMQIQEQCVLFDSTCGIKSACIYGGVSKSEQYKLLRKGVHIVVATPGRLLDLINENVCDISKVSYLVLDEGFEDDVRTIIRKTSKNRQTVMFSATWPESVRKLANDFLTHPIRVTIGSPDLSANNNVTQIVEVLEDRERDKRLLSLLERYHNRKNRVLVFVLYKKEASRIENMLASQGYETLSIHGDKSQFQRTEALKAFKDGIYPLLIATDVAARGLDIPDVEYVINYSFPLTIEDYVHRIGRTGRAGNKGISHTLFTPHDKTHSGELANILRQAKQKVPESLLKFGGGVKKKEHKAYGAFYKEIDPSLKPTKIKFED
ncbi:7754_t:CDS:2 [Diversispora eburnea]|uniref:RNA helicase n=1 Tax=Diversispora eburnea TaxID=1213867 RepID=A0A9N9B6L8_9GLOM|nr:7754_t:CDS:2 [Diversispora eburnea]